MLNMNFFPVVNDKNIELRPPNSFIVRKTNGHIFCKGIMFDQNILSFNMLYTYIITDDEKYLYLFDMKYESPILGMNQKDTYIVNIFKWIKENLPDIHIKYLCIYDTQYKQTMKLINDIDEDGKATIFSSNTDKNKDIYPDIGLLHKSIITEVTPTDKIKVHIDNISNFNLICKLIKLETQLFSIEDNLIVFQLKSKRQLSNISERKLLEEYGIWV